MTQLQCLYGKIVSMFLFYVLRMDYFGILRDMMQNTLLRLKVFASHRSH